MSFIIDAWLERSNPYLKVIHKQTGIAVLSWQKDMLNKQLANGSLCIEDLSCSPSQDLIKELFILDCID